MGWGTSELLNDVSEIILADVIYSRLRLLPGRIVVRSDGICVCISKVRLVQRALSYVLPNLVHTQMITVMPVLGVVHPNLPTLLARQN